MALVIDIAFDPRSGSYNGMTSEAERILECYGATVSTSTIECAGKGTRISYCQCITSGSFIELSDKDLKDIRRVVRSTPGLWVDAIVERDRLQWGSKLYKRGALKIDKKHR